MMEAGGKLRALKVKIETVAANHQLVCAIGRRPIV